MPECAIALIVLIVLLSIGIIERGESHCRVLYYTTLMMMAHIKGHVIISDNTV